MSVGRGVFWKKNTVDDARRLDMAGFAQDVDFESTEQGSTTWYHGREETARIGWQVCPPYRLKLYYSVTMRDGQKDYYDYYVNLDTTQCNFGGKRWWFLCPNNTCGRRCRILYQAPGSDYFLCRICQNLTYRSQQEGQNLWGTLIKALLTAPELQRKLYRTRSPEKRAKLLKKIDRLCGDAQRAIDEKRTKS